MIQRGGEIEGVSCVVLTGGESRRMGRNKCSVELGGRTLLERVAETVRPLFSDLMLSVHTEADAGRYPEVPGARVVEDTLPGRGPVLGVCAALEKARNPWLMVVSCDVPMLAAKLVRLLAALRGGCDCVVPVAGGKTQTLLALYRTSLLPPLRERVLGGRRGLAAFLEETGGLRVRYVGEDELKGVDPGLLSFSDVDTDEELDRVKTILREKERGEG